MVKANNKLVKYLFLNYSNTMYSSKSKKNFEDNHQRKEILNSVEVIKMVKDYKLMQFTTAQEIQNLIRDINVKIIGRKDIVNELDLEGF